MTALQPAAARPLSCTACQAMHAPGTRFCGQCGVALGPARALPPSSQRSAGLLKRTADGVSGVVGLEGVQRFSLGELFSEVFKRRSIDELEDRMLAGTRKNTPPVMEIDTEWPRPWLFGRAFGAALLLYLLFQLGWFAFSNTNLLPGLLVTGAFVVPISAVILFYELNTPRNISMLVVLKLVFVGGAASLLMSLVLFRLGSDLTRIFSASAAGFIEETGKLAAVVFAARKLSPVRFRYTLNGLLLGAAVGTGFSAFESAGYAFHGLINGHASDMTFSIILRGVLSPFGHPLWTGITAAALWRVKGARPFSSEMLADGRFLRLFFFSVTCHFIWNAGFDLFVPLLKNLLLGAAGWTVAFSLVQDGLRQIRTEQAVAQRLKPAPADEPAPVSTLESTSLAA
jgi:RsiW-degrading membrane proteinase PrsW (M82 family)